MKLLAILLSMVFLFGCRDNSDDPTTTKPTPIPIPIATTPIPDPVVAEPVDPPVPSPKSQKNASKSTLKIDIPITENKAGEGYVEVLPEVDTPEEPDPGELMSAPSLTSPPPVPSPGTNTPAPKEDRDSHGILLESNELRLIKVEKDVYLSYEKPLDYKQLINSEFVAIKSDLFSGYEFRSASVDFKFFDGKGRWVYNDLVSIMAPADNNEAIETDDLDFDQDGTFVTLFYPGTFLKHLCETPEISGKIKSQEIVGLKAFFNLEFKQKDNACFFQIGTRINGI